MSAETEYRETRHSLAPGRTKGSYSYDGKEPRHMHVDREKLSAKLWLDPDVRIAENLGYGRQELRELERIACQNIELLRREWDEFCGSDTDAN